MADEQPRLGDPEQRPTPPSTGGLRGAEDVSGPKLVEYVGRKMLVCPLQHEEWETTQGPADVLVSQIIVYSYTLDSNNSPVVEWEDLGETPVFWQRVQKQLDEQATPDYPWVVGTLTRPGRAYSIEAPLPEDLTAAEKVLEQYRADTDRQF